MGPPRGEGTVGAQVDAGTWNGGDMEKEETLSGQGMEENNSS